MADMKRVKIAAHSHDNFFLRHIYFNRCIRAEFSKFSTAELGHLRWPQAVLARKFPKFCPNTYDYLFLNASAIPPNPHTMAKSETIQPIKGREKIKYVMTTPTIMAKIKESFCL